MSVYNFTEIEKKWQKFWKENKTFKADIDESKPKYYILDMFPYPSGAGLHVGHPLGYIATDIIGRFKKLKGYNVLHPMGFDAFGLPAEQYAIQTGQHPAVTTEENIARYKEQLENIGFSYDWDKEVRTSDPDFYKWTQWIFKQLYNSWYNKSTDKAEAIEELVAAFEKNGNQEIKAHCDEDTELFTADDWKGYSDAQKSAILLKYRLTYLADTVVNWCPALGTVLSNDEVKDGFSERGGHPVERKKMPQWNMRITAYADRLINDLQDVDWPDPIKEMQKNWIGKSKGAEVTFQVENTAHEITVFTTRIDTIYGVTFLVLAPESELVEQIVSEDQKEEVTAYATKAKNRSERERMSDVKTVSGAFTGAYALNPYNQERIPIWIADYVLAGYGTGAVMAVPAGDQRDHDFAKHFDLPIQPIIDGTEVDEKADPTKEGKMINSGILDGLSPMEAIDKACDYAEENGFGKTKVNFKIRDAVFGRQRYWGEPFPVYFKDDQPQLLADDKLPLELPPVDKFLPTETGEPPLGRAENWHTVDGYPYEMTTMPGWAGSSWYFFRYMDPANDQEFASKEALNYWQDVDLYVGGSEHATGHLLYSRFWTKFLYDRGLVPVKEYAKKLVNQGMIQGRSSIAYRINGTNTYVSKGLRKEHDTAKIHVDVNMVENDVLDIESFKNWRPDLKDAEFILEDGKYICGDEVEKMSKRLYNVVNPDDIVAKYGADTLRMYEMFLGPLEQFKPWNTHGIDGVYKFLRKFWSLYFDGNNQYLVSEEKASPEELKILHKAIQKVEDDVDRLSLNTSVSHFMITVNELIALKCHKKEILEPLAILLSPFAPHICEEIWQIIGNAESISKASYPQFEQKYVVEASHEYPVSINGKVRTKLSFAIDEDKAEIEKQVLANEMVQKWTEGKTPKKVIIVPKRIINLVV
ncbi:MAG: leucine--tRNA ligase [Bacteroidota bacterium]